MKVICDEHSESAAKEIGEPIKEIVSGTAGGEGLAVFIDDAENAEKDDGKQITGETRASDAVFEK